MSWALSCLCLRKYYDEVALYADEQGKHLLIDLLHLPYTEVNVVYDETLCLPQHWSYAKVKTYSLQTKPFLHIDGDIFLFKPIPEEVINAPLIAQSKEIGTEYYRQMMDRILQESALTLPEYLEDGLKEASIASYNMGVFGGNDMEFIHAYCEEALAICDTNKSICLNGNFNLLFEQMLFAYKAKKEKKQVSTLFPNEYYDNGYTAREFCNFSRYGENKLLHILGGHKRSKSITYSFERFMLTYHPNSTEDILRLVDKRNKYNCLSLCRAQINSLIYRIVPGFEDFVERKLSSDIQASNAVLLNEERQRMSTLPFFDEQKGKDSFVKRITGLSIYELPKSISETDMEKLKSLLECEPHFPLSHIALYPSLRQDFFEAVPLEITGFRILAGIRNEVMSVGELRTWIIKEICQITGTTSIPLLRFAMQHIKYLINTGILILENYN